MKIPNALAAGTLLALFVSTTPIEAGSNPSISQAAIYDGNDARIEYVHRRHYYRSAPRHYYRRGYGYRGHNPYYYRPYYYRPYYYGYPRHGYIGPNYGYYGYPYYRRWYGPGFHLHFGW